METIKVTTSQNIDIDYEIAGLGERILGRLIDWAILIVLVIIGSVIFFATSSFGRNGSYVVIAVLLLFFALYDLICELTMNGQSLGKKVMKTRVISLDGGQATFGQFFLRWLFRIVDFTLSSEVLALVCVAVTDKKQRLGDVVAGTIVIKTTPRTQITQIAYQHEVEEYIPVYREVLLLNDSDIALIHEVISSYRKSGNPDIVYTMANKASAHLHIKPLPEMHELAFLQTIVKDYTHLTSVQFTG